MSNPALAPNEHFLPLELRLPCTRRRAEFLPFSPPLVGSEEVEEIVDTLRSDRLNTGPKTRPFAGEFAA